MHGRYLVVAANVFPFFSEKKKKWAASSYILPVPLRQALFLFCET
jgi:hypothetical protein